MNHIPLYRCYAHDNAPLAVTLHATRGPANSTSITSTVALGGGLTTTKLTASRAEPSSSTRRAAAEAPSTAAKRPGETRTNLLVSPSRAQPPGSTGASVASAHACVPLGKAWPGEVHACSDGAAASTRVTQDPG